MAIIMGELEAGSRVDERRLARDFGLGEAAVRDALFRLSLEGLVHRQPRIGTRIGDLNLRELQDVFEARVLLESYACSVVATRASAVEIAAIRASYAGHDDAVDRRDVRRLVEIDRAFHGGLAAACKNVEIEQALLRLHNNACRFWVFGIDRTSPEEVKAQGRAHLDILIAIENKDLAEIERRVRKAIGYNPDSRFFVYQPRLSLVIQPAA
jgi:DNA-binding GntR family transcriptional regulator